MEVFILLVLSIGLCQSKAVHHVLDSNNPEVVGVVDRAIKALNEDRSHGNKFAPGVILLAYGLTGLEKKLHIMYQVRETMCPVAVDKPWQKCELLRTSIARSGNCVAEIDISESQQFTSISQNCQISRGQKMVAQSLAQCPGCWQHINTHSAKVKRIVMHTLQQFNNQSQQPSLFGCSVIKDAQSQVVNGVNYRFAYSIKETNCSKSEFADLSPECKPLSGGLKGFCNAKAYTNNRGALISSQVECKLGGEDSPIATDSQEPERPLEAVVKLFNHQSSSNFYYKIVEITKISGKMMVGHVFQIDFKTQRTNCSKAEVKKPDDNCTVVKGGEMMTCHALIYVKPWEPSVVPEVTCTDEQPFQASELEEPKYPEDHMAIFDYDNTIDEHESYFKKKAVSYFSRNVRLLEMMGFLGFLTA